MTWGGDDGRSTGGLSNTPPVPKPLSTKAFQEKTGGREVNYKFLPILHLAQNRSCQLYEAQLRDGEEYVGRFEFEQRVVEQYAKVHVMVYVEYKIID